MDRLETPLRTPAHNLTLHTPLPHLYSSDSDALIYGTNIMLGKAIAAIQKFILEFEQARMLDGELVSEQVYRIKLNDLEQEEGETVFECSFSIPTCRDHTLPPMYFLSSAISLSRLSTPLMLAAHW